MAMLPEEKERFEKIRTDIVYRMDPSKVDMSAVLDRLKWIELRSERIAGHMGFYVDQIMSMKREYRRTFIDVVKEMDELKKSIEALRDEIARIKEVIE